MTDAVKVQTPTYLETLDQIIAEVIEPAAAEIDATGAFPRAAMDATCGLPLFD